MELKSVTKLRENGSIQYKESANVFNVEDSGNGIARGQLSCAKLPYEKSKNDQALVNAGKVDQRGYIRGSFYVSFRGNAYQKALNLSNGAIIEDIVIDIDPFPYVDKNGQVQYRQNPQIMVIDFNVRQTNGGNQNGTQTVTNEQPFTPQKPYPVSPSYNQNNQQNNNVAYDNYSEY